MALAIQIMETSLDSGIFTVSAFFSEIDPALNFHSEKAFKTVCEITSQGSTLQLSVSRGLS